MMLDERIHAAAELFKRAKYVVAFTGAGISTPSGIPDYRSPHSGLWENANPIEVASMYGFRQNPQAFYNWIYPLTRLIINAQPNPAHLALVQLEKLGILKGIVTQNIDMLHTRAGSENVYELHGHLREATCVHCFTVYPAEPIIRQFFEDRKVPHCPKCGGVIKPNVILYGEQLPVAQLQAARDAVRKADLMLIIGSSLEVAPASELPALASRAGAKLVIVNIEPTPIDEKAEVVIRADAAEVLPKIVNRLEAIA